MKKISFIFMILILFVLVNFYKSQIISYANAQTEEVQTITPDPNVIDALKAEIEKVEMELARKRSEDINEQQELDFNETDVNRIEADSVDNKESIFMYERDVEGMKRYLLKFSEEQIKRIKKRIENDNIRFKDRIFGGIFHGFAMSIEPVKEKYEIGKGIEISALYKNFSNEQLVLIKYNDSQNKYDFRYAMYFPDGSAVPKSEFAKEYENTITSSRIRNNNPPRISSFQTPNFLPQQIEHYTMNISRFFNIEKPGIYNLVIMRRITESWEDGFMISNMTTINIVDNEQEQ